MKIGVPKETKTSEGRVGLTPDGVRTLVEDGHTVLVESTAGLLSGFQDKEYLDAGGTITSNVWESELIVKVKEPSVEECSKLKQGQTLFTYLHLAANQLVLDALIDSGVTAIAYENIEDYDNHFPILSPMSVIAGRLAVQIGMQNLELPSGGKGILFGMGDTYRLRDDIPRARVVVIGMGEVGRAAIDMAMANDADVVGMDIDEERLFFNSYSNNNKFRSVLSTPESVSEEVAQADLLIGAVLSPGSKAPTVVTIDDVGNMADGSVIVDVAIDQGGCIETSKETTWETPVRRYDGKIQCAIANLPGAVPRTSTFALTNVTLPYIRLLANLENDLVSWDHLKNAVSVRGGTIVDERLL